MSKEKEHKLNEFKNRVYKELVEIIKENKPYGVASTPKKSIVPFSKEKLTKLIAIYEKSSEYSEGSYESELELLLYDLYVIYPTSKATAYWVGSKGERKPRYYTYMDELLTTIKELSVDEIPKSIYSIDNVVCDILNSFETKEIADLLRKTYL